MIESEDLLVGSLFTLLGSLESSINCKLPHLRTLEVFHDFVVLLLVILVVVEDDIFEHCKFELLDGRVGLVVGSEALVQVLLMPLLSRRRLR